MDEKDTLSQILDVDFSTSDNIKIFVGRGASAIASIFHPMVIVGLNDVPLTVFGIKFVDMGCIKSISADDNTFILFGTSKNNVAESIDLLFGEALVSAVIVIAFFKSVSE